MTQLSCVVTMISLPPFVFVLVFLKRWVYKNNCLTQLLCFSLITRLFLFSHLNATFPYWNVWAWYRFAKTTQLSGRFMSVAASEQYLYKLPFSWNRSGTLGSWTRNPVTAKINTQNVTGLLISMFLLEKWTRWTGFSYCNASTDAWLAHRFARRPLL